MRPELIAYIEREILPRYERFDRAHRRDHAEQVICESLRLAEGYELSREMVYTIAAYHDTGLDAGRERHHLRSGEIVRTDPCLRQWFDVEQIELMAQAAEDHRASHNEAPRSIYGCIVAEADRALIPEMILERTVQYGLSHYPEKSYEEQFARFVEHLNVKYGEGGYLKMWLPNPAKEERLAQLRHLIADREALRAHFDRIYQHEQSKTTGV